MDEMLISALDSIPVADLTRAEWLSVGMALKESGYPVSVWDEWSKNDKRYHKGECARLWSGFRGTSNPVKAGTIIQMAKDHGWQPYKGDDILGWDSPIEYDGISEEPPQTKKWDPVEELTTYIELLFKPDEYVAYVTNDVYTADDGRLVPSKGVFSRTAGELLASLKRHPDDIGWTVGDWKPDAGAWIRFNPVDGHGVKNDNVTAFRYALVESDTLSIQEQDELYRRLELPIAALVYSGGKSLHAIVRIDAPDIDEYYKRVDFLYDFLRKQDVDIDRQNRNPSRLSRMPGATRKGKKQYLVATNIGKKSWSDWVDYTEGISYDLPEIMTLEAYLANPPKIPDELIGGILRKGHKCLLSGPSKAGKSFFLMELAIAIAEGKKWVNFTCQKGRVLYIHLEIDPASAIERFRKIYEKYGMEPEHAADIEIWNLRGYAQQLDELTPKIIRKIADKHIDAIILDPIYKVSTGDENSASDMGKFCNQFDKICTETGASMIYCHHHSKGAQGGKKAIDRSSGSGVFGRDPDALIDMIELELTDDLKNNVVDGDATAWRLEFNLREFANPKPINIWFEYPIHYLDKSNELGNIHPAGSWQANLSKSPNRTTPESRASSVSAAYYALNTDPKMPVTVQEMAEYMGVTVRTARSRIDETGEYEVKKGCVSKIEK